MSLDFEMLISVVIFGLLCAITGFALATTTKEQQLREDIAALNMEHERLEQRLKAIIEARKAEATE